MEELTRLNQWKFWRKWTISTIVAFAILDLFEPVFLGAFQVLGELLVYLRNRGFESIPYLIVVSGSGFLVGLILGGLQSRAFPRLTNVKEKWISTTALAMGASFAISTVFITSLEMAFWDYFFKGGIVGALVGFFQWVLNKQELSYRWILVNYLAWGTALLVFITFAFGTYRIIFMLFGIVIGVITGFGMLLELRHLQSKENDMILDTATEIP